MLLSQNQYGARPLDEAHYHYHAFELKGLSMLDPATGKAIDLALKKALKQLGEG